MSIKDKKVVSAAFFLVGFLIFVLSPASASERLCDASFEDCRTPLIALIQKENVQIDIAFWFLDDSQIENALISKIKAGVKVRMMVDPRADGAHPTNTAILQTFATMTPQFPQMRKRVQGAILHWKMALFAGQGVVEFSGANLSRSEMVPYTNYVNYTDEAIFFSDDAAIVNSFRTMYDRWWVDTVAFADYANSTQPTASYATYPIETEGCAAVPAVQPPNGCGLDFLPSSHWQDNYGTKVESALGAEKTKIDVDMFRITNAAIANSMIAAFQRGVPIRMIVDSSEYINTARVWNRYNVDRMFMAGIPLKTTKHLGQNHEKSVLAYGQGLAIWGSSNWSSASFNDQQEHNYFSTSPVNPWFFQWFVNQFERRWNSSQEYQAFVPVPPSQPVSQSPANGATGLSQNVTLTWNGGPWGQRYDIYLGTGATSPLTLIASNVVTGTPDPPPQHVSGTFKLSGLAPNTTYRWRIISKTMANLTSGGPIWSFTTGGTAPTSGATISSISPGTGPSAGGTSVTITGTNFAPGATVSFGFAAASKIVVVNSTTITATTPPHVGGSASVTVINPSGTSGSLAAGFVYNSPLPSTTPQLNVVVPNTGSPQGGTAITISGSNFVAGLTVTIGGSAATVTSRGLNSIQATVPAGNAGTAADIVVRNPNGQSATLKAAFTYANPPASPVLSAIKNVDSSVSLNSGSFNGGTKVVISGSGFQYGSVVSFGGPAPYPATDSTGFGKLATTVAVTYSSALCGGVPLPCIIATTPPFAVGATDVWVTNLNPATGVIDSGSGSSRLTAAYTFVLAPSIKALTPPSGSVSGGTQITITGTNFQSGATVFVGNQQASIVNPTSSTSITAVAPANTAGTTAAVTVMNPDKQQSNTLIFTYQ
jgi:phosphatidylserine/phosphatidylglycerophosphate/cardiolipin synthase-like enzyme